MIIKKTSRIYSFFIKCTICAIPYFGMMLIVQFGHLSPVWAEHKIFFFDICFIMFQMRDFIFYSWKKIDEIILVLLLESRFGNAKLMGWGTLGPGLLGP